MKALRAALQDKHFSPAYLLHGQDEFLKEEALRHLIDAAVDSATRDFNFDQRRGAETDAATLSSLVNSPPMMAERRVVVIRVVTALKKDARAALEKYLRSPASDVLVIMTVPADAKLDKTLPSLAEDVNCAPLSGALVPKWIVSRVEKTYGSTITPAAVELLQDAVGSDLAELAIELEKLAAYCGSKPIDEAAVTHTVGVRRDETPGRLLDAVAMRDAALALSLVPGVLNQPKQNAVLLVMMLTTQTLALAVGLTRNIRQSNDYYNLLKSGASNMTGRSWGDAVSAWTRAAGKWSKADLDHALEALLRADLALKDSRVSSEEHVLATTILSMCNGPQGASRTAA